VQPALVCLVNQLQAAAAAAAAASTGFSDAVALWHMPASTYKQQGGAVSYS
jgi:hypothetical protein